MTNQMYDVVIIVGSYGNEREISRTTEPNLAAAQANAAFHNMGSDYSTAIVQKTKEGVK